MPKWITAVFVFFLSTTLLKAKAITVDDIISKHIQVSQSNGSKLIGSGELELVNFYAENGSRARLEGVENFDGISCYDISIKNKAGLTIHYLVDTTSWFVIRKYIKTVRQKDNPVIN